MMNALRRWLSPNNRELLQLREEVLELSDAVTNLTERFKRWDARQRQRAQRGWSDEPAPAGARDRECGDCADSVVPGAAVPALANGQDRSATREQLRQLARARGLIA